MLPFVEMIKRTPKKKKNPHALAMVKRRMVKLSPQKRSEIAANAARARWAGVNGNAK